VFFRHQSDQFRKALPVQVSHRFTSASARFDDDHLVSCAGLVPVMTVAAQIGLPQLLADKICIYAPRIKSGSANPAPKLATLIAGMCAGADSIDDVDLVRSGGMKTLFEQVYAPSTIGTLLREFTFGHARQLESVLRHHLGALCGRVELLPGSDLRAFVDIDSLLRPVYGHAKQGASYGHTKIAGKQILRKGLSPLITTISTETGAPVITGARLRAGRANSGRGAARMLAQAVAAARAAGVAGEIVVRGDSAYGTYPVINACRRSGTHFSVVLGKNTAVAAAISAIPEQAWTPVSYPGAVRDPDTGDWISDAEVAETAYTASASTSHPVTARLIVRRVKDARYPDTLFPIWRYHPFVTDTDDPTLMPTSPTAATRSSKPSSPTSSTAPWHTCPRADSVPTAAGSCAQPSRITCYAPPGSSPVARRPSPVGPLCAARSSTSPPDWPAPNADPCCTYRRTGPGQTHGFACGTTPSENTHHR